MTTVCPALQGRIVVPTVVGRLRAVTTSGVVALSDGEGSILTGDGAVLALPTFHDGWAPILRGRINTPTITGRWC